MSSTLSRELRAKHGVRAVPIRKDDEVEVKKGEHKGRQGTVKAVYRKKFVIHIDRLTRENQKGKSWLSPCSAFVLSPPYPFLSHLLCGLPQTIP